MLAIEDASRCRQAGRPAIDPELIERARLALCPGSELRPAPSYPGYAASSCGLIVSFRPSLRVPGEFRVIKIGPKKVVQFNKAAPVHARVIIADAFLGPAPHADMEVYPLDGDPHNLAADNIGRRPGPPGGRSCRGGRPKGPGRRASSDAGLRNHAASYLRAYGKARWAAESLLPDTAEAEEELDAIHGGLYDAAGELIAAMDAAGTQAVRYDGRLLVIATGEDDIRVVEVVDGRSVLDLDG